MTVGGSGRRGGGGGVLFGLLPPLLLLLYCLLSIQAHAVPNAAPIAASTNNQATHHHQPQPKQNLQQAQTCNRPPASPQSAQQHQQTVHANTDVPIPVTQASSETLAAAGGRRGGEGAAHLSISIRGLQDVPSTVISYGTIDLTNTHTSHPLKIRSMETGPMLLVSERRSAGGGRDALRGNTVDVGSTTYQIDISEFGDRVLTLGPGQSASLPISMYPAIPSDYLEHQLYGGPMEVPPSKAAAATAASTESPSAEELASAFNDWIEYRERTLEMAEEYEDRLGLGTDELLLGGKSPTLLADTMELERGIDYSGQHDVAPTIMSEIFSSARVGSDLADAGSAIPPSILRQQKMKHGDPKEWKQYVRSDRNMQTKIGMSLWKNPRLHVVMARLHIEIDNIPEKLQTPIWTSAVRINTYGLPSTITFRPEPSQIATFGPRHVGTYHLYMVNPNRDQDLIVHEVYASNPNIVRVSPNDSPDELSFPGNDRAVKDILQQYGLSGKFISQVDRISDGPVVLRPAEAGFIASVNLLTPFQIDPNAEMNSLPDFLGYVHIRTSVGTMAVALESAPAEFDEAFEAESNNMVVHGSGTVLSESIGPPNFDQDVRLKSEIGVARHDETPSELKLLSSSPAAVQFGLLSSPLEEAQFSTISLNITNHAEESLRIMRVAIGIDDRDHGVPDASTAGINVEVLINGTSPGDSIGASTPESIGDVVVPAGATLDGVLSVVCRPNLTFGGDAGSNGRPLPQQFSGLIVIRATLASMESFEQWRQVAAKEPTANETQSLDHVLLEVPFKVDVFHGSLSYDASQTYFPVGMAARQSSISSDAMLDTQRIDIVNEFPFPLFLLSADIVGVGKGSSSRCQAQFEALHFGGTHKNTFVFDVRHNDLKATDGVTAASRMDDKCGLSLQMLFGSYPPVQFVVPLSTYDGRLAARLDHSYADTSDVRFLACQGRWQDDEECIENWYQNTNLGQVLKDHVGDKEISTRKQRRKRGKESSKLNSLLEYLSQPKGSDPAPSEVDPVVLDLGVLPLSSRRSYSLLLTNPNPVPMEVLPDYGGSIEGMSIGLGKVRIDSLTLLKKGTESPSEDPHSLLSEGMRQFLSSSEPSRAFFGRLADSDDVFPATRKDCDLITPQLSNLFYKQATVTLRASSPDPPPRPKSGAMPSAYRREGPPLMSCFSGGNIPGLDSDDDCQSSSWFTRRKECIEQGAAGVLFSDSGIKCFIKPAASNSTTTPTSISKKDIWYLPPASTARLDLTIITPPWSVLRRLSKSRGGTTSMLPFLSTGLVLRSSLGQAIPIVVTYQALLAELNAGAEGNFLSMGPYVGEEETRAIDDDHDDHGPTGRLYHNRVDPTIVQSYPSAMNGAKRRRTPLQIRSTLDDSFEIVKLSSCNPWFDIQLDGSRTKKPKESDQSMHRKYRMYDAFALSTIRCEESNFLSCALLFLESRSLVQPTGCGLSEADAAMEYAYRPELTWNNHRYEHIMQSLSESSMTKGGSPFNLKTRKWNGNRMLDLAHARSHDIKVKDTTSANMDGKVHGDELQYAWQWLGVPFDYVSDAAEEDSKQGVKSEAIDALREASKRLVAMYSESVEKLRFDRAEEPEKALVHHLDVKPFLDARNVWKKVKEQKLHLMTGGLRATIQQIPESSDGKAIEPFTTDVPLSLLWTYLDPPSIFDSRPQGAPNATYRVDWGGTGIIDFSLTALSEVKTLYVPVHNPSEIPVRVRLTTFKPLGPNETASTHSAKWAGVDHRAAWSEDDLYLFDEDISPLHVHPFTKDAWWWNGGAYYQVSGDGTTLRSRRNVTIKSTDGSSSALPEPNIFANSALITGCGRRRCGLRDDQQQQAQANQNEAIANFLKAPVRLYSAMGASAVKRVHLRGHIYDPVSGEESDESSSYKAGKCLDWFSPSCPSVWDVVQPFAISMSSLQEEIVLDPNEKAWLGPIYFRPSAASRFGSTILIENSLTGIEPIKLTGVGATRQIAFEEAGGVDPAETSLEIRHGMPTLMFPGTAEPTEPWKAVRRSVKIRNTGGIPIELRSASLAPFSLSQVTQRPVSSNTKNSARGCSVGGFTLFGCADGGFDDNGFTLEPGESGTISILHSPRCSMRKSFVVLNLDYSSKEAGYSALADAEGSQLLVGFDMSHEDMASCVPLPFVVHPSFANKVRGVEKLYRQDRSTWNPFFWSDVIKREDSNMWRQMLLFVWPILLLLVCVAYGVGIDRKVRRRFLSTTQIDIHDLVSGVGNDPSMARLPGTSYGTGDLSHHKALYQVAQSDPNSADLAQAGRDQTRRLLLGKYRRVQAAMPRCLRPNGDFFFRGGANPAATAASPTSEREGTKSNAAAKAVSRGSRPARVQGSLADEIFGHSASSLSSSDTNAALPIALSWRGAATRGILPHPSRVSVGVGNRVGDLLKKRAELRRESSYADPVVAEAVAIVDDESKDDDSVPTTIIPPSNATAEGIQTVTPDKTQEDEKEDDIASLLPSSQKVKSSEKTSSQYVVPVSTESAIDTKGVSEGDWHIQSGGHKKTPRDTVPSAASTAASSLAAEESKRPEVSKKTSR